MTTIIGADMSTPMRDLSAFEEIGRSVDSRSFVDQAPDLGLDWEIKQIPVQLPSDMYEGKVALDWKALVRSDTGDIFNIPKKRYVPVQPRQILEFFDTLRTDEGLEMDTIGVLGGGKVIWGLARTGRELGFSEEDRVKEYILAASSADYSFSSVVKRTSIRVVCRNTLELALGAGDEGQGFVKRSHAGAFDFAYARQKIAAIREDKVAIAEFAKEGARMAARKVTVDEADKYFAKLLFPGKKLSEIRESKRSSTRLDEVMALYASAPGQELDTARGTAWGLLNTVTFLVDHVQGKTADSRMRSGFFAEGAALKEKARQLAAKLAA